MVKFMPFIISVDGQGRMVLPKEVRQALGIKGGSRLVCRVVGNKAILERLSVDMAQEAFNRLEEIAPSLEVSLNLPFASAKRLTLSYRLTEGYLYALLP